MNSCLKSLSPPQVNQMVVAMAITNARTTDVQRVQFTHQLVGQGRMRFQMVMMANAASQLALSGKQDDALEFVGPGRTLVDAEDARQVLSGGATLGRGVPVTGSTA